MTEESSEAMTESAAPATPTTIHDLKPKMQLKGVVKRLELYGAFIDVGVGINALIHISQLGKDRVNRVSDVLKVGDEVTVWVSRVQPDRDQIMVTMVPPLAVEWSDLKPNQVYTGRVSRLENFGAFVDIGAEREGLVHISELSHEYVKHPAEVLQVGSEIQVQVLGFNKRKRRIDLSIKALLDKPDQVAPASTGNGAQYEEEDDFDEEMPTAMEIAMRKAMGDDIAIRRRPSNRKRRKRRRAREKQEEILNRTLQIRQMEG